MKEEKIKITRLKCIAENVVNLTKDKEYILIRIFDDEDGNIQVEICNNAGKIYWYPISLFEIIHSD